MRKALLVVYCSSFFLVANIGHTEDAEVSSITFPISIDLSYVADRANKELPQRLASFLENNAICYEGKKAKYEYPCVYDWYKTKMCEGWTWSIPPIRCDITGYVDRRGPLTLSGSGEKLLLSLPIHASVSAKALVSETAKADATFFASAAPSITENWEPVLRVEADFRWDKRPTLKLFNFIDVTIGSKVEPELRKEMEKLKAQIPDMLQDLDFRGEAQDVWDQIQQPIRISESPEIYATFVPASVGFSGLMSEGGNLKATVRIEGRTSVVLGAAPEVQPVPLLPLQGIDHQAAGFAMVIPTIIEKGELQATLSERLSDGMSISLGGDSGGIVTVSDIVVSLSEAEGIRLDFDVLYDNRSKFLEWIDIFDWFDFAGSASMSAKPRLDTESNTIFVEGLRLDASTSSGLADTLVDVLDLPLVRDRIATLITYDYAQDVQNSLSAANEAINVELEEGVRISGNLTGVGADDLVVQNDAISVLVRATGSVEATIGR